MGLRAKKIDARGPLDPDPFLTTDARGFSLGSPAVLIEPYLHRSLGRFALARPCSLAGVAYIPPGHLKGIYWFFADDSLSAQPDWLSSAVALNRFRFVHGLQVWTSGDAGLALWPPQGTGVKPILS